tara:strand:- start:7905 stop:8912 length:1008 start_codon:yes stop_codon:yes gene_type:complete
MIEWQYFRFQDPWLLFGMIVIPILIMVYRDRRQAVIRFSSIATLKMLVVQRPKLLRIFPIILRCITVIILILALARPQEGRYTREILSRGVDIMLAIDTSGSMRALDFTRGDQRITRLNVVKEVVSNFVGNRSNDRLGLIAFGAEAFTQCPLTLDHEVVLKFINKMTIGMAGDSTAIGSAIGIAVKRLKDLEAKSKVIVLLTDGRNNAGFITPEQSANIAKTYGVKIYTIGVGTRGRVPFLVDTILGQRYVYQQVNIDEVTLKSIAEKTGAQYFRATDLESLRNIYAQIDQLETSDVKIKEHTNFTELFPIFLVPSLMCLLLEIFISNTRLQRIP